jgi:hypothetical protein
MRLLFTPRKRSGAIVLTRLPPLPIVVDCSRRLDLPSKAAVSRATAALGYPERVRRIIIEGPDLLLDSVYPGDGSPFSRIRELRA